ncbi:V-type proton ATPase subunit C-like [Phlebotomus papatasi]|uniref:V-type proton ATPase subunit C-like n=1 Tax=Phlebotomus papatasi TaxID=29031 RepID=UPI0024839B82|nr:V-type proton ATPase subunit C-like [Phlebotomus papatasi]
MVKSIIIGALLKGPGPPDDDSPEETQEVQLSCHSHDTDHCSACQRSFTNSTGSEKCESECACGATSNNYGNQNHHNRANHHDDDLFDWWFHRSKSSKKSRSHSSSQLHMGGSGNGGGGGGGGSTHRSSPVSSCCGSSSQGRSSPDDDDGLKEPPSFPLSPALNWRSSSY